MKMSQAVVNHKNMGQELNEVQAFPFAAQTSQLQLWNHIPKMLQLILWLVRAWRALTN